MLAMAFALIPGTPGSDAGSVTALEEGDVIMIGGEEFYVVHANSVNTDSSLEGYRNVYVIGSASQTLAAGAFSKCTTVEKVYFSGTVRNIGDGAFENMPRLVEVDAPGIKTVGEDAFRGSSVQRVDFSLPLEDIGDNAFRDCDSLAVLDLNRTSVDSLGQGVFMNSGIGCIDLRGVTSIRADTFSNSGLTLQIVTSDQKAYVRGVDLIVFDDQEEFYESSYCIDGRMTFVTDGLRFIEVHDENGEEIQVEISEDAEDDGAYLLSFDTEEGVDYVIGSVDAVVRYPEGMGIDQTEVVVDLDAGPLILDEPTLGELEFINWRIEGLDGEYDRIDLDTLIMTGGSVVLVPVFGDAYLHLDHSSVSDYSDTSSLEDTVLFTYGDVYPDVEDVYGYTFTGWRVDDVTYSAGDPIVTYREHTAFSIWTPSLYHKLTYSSPDGTALKVQEVAHNQYAGLDPSVTTDGDPSQRFVGWSLDGRTVLEDGDTILMDGDKTLVPVFEERALMTVEFLVDGNVWAERTCYDGRSITIDVEDPVSEKIFVHWSAAGGLELVRGDSLTVTSDMRLTAEWRERHTYEIVFKDPEGDDFEDHKTEGMAYTISHAGTDTEELIFDHWIADDGTEYRIGDTISDDAPLELTAVHRERDTYTVTYMNGGTVLETEPAREGLTFTIGFPDPSKDGAFFVEWVDENGGRHSHGDELTVGSDLKLTAVWREPGSLTVTYFDGESALGTADAIEGEEFTVSLSDPSKDGFVFTGWMAPDGTVLDNGETLVVWEDIGLSAQWRPLEEFTLTYTDNGEELGTVFGTEGTSLRIEAENPVRDGMIFLHWTDGVNDYVRGDEVLMSADIVLSAVWRDAEEFTVSYVDGDRTVSVDAGLESTMFEIRQEDLPDTWLREFLCWSDGESEYRLGDSFVLDHDVVLKAVWRDFEFYDLNFVSEGELVHSESLREGTPTPVEVDDPALEGMVFLGWEDADGNRFVSGDTVTLDSDRIYHALWRDLYVFTVTYTDGTSVIETAECVEGSELTIDTEDPVSDGKIFLHWTDGDGNVYHRGDSLVPASDMSLNAVWRAAERFTVTYMVDGMTFSEGSGLEGSDFVISCADPDGSIHRDFVCWTDGQSEYRLGDGFVLEGDVVLTAVCQEFTVYELTYRSDDTPLHTESARMGESLTVSLEPPEKEGMVFEYWVDQHGDVFLTGDEIVMHEDTVLDASWRLPYVFTITFVDGDITLGTASATEGSGFEIAVSDPTREGMVFTGWEGPDGSIHVRGDRVEVGSDLVLTSQWRQAVKFTVTYMDGTNVVAEFQGWEHTEFTITQEDPEDTQASEFLHWTDGESSYGLGDSFVLEGDVVLSAVWQDYILHEVTFVSEGQVLSAKTVRDGEPCIIDADAGTRDGYNLEGWSMTEGGDAEFAQGDSFVPVEDVVLHAVWIEVDQTEEPPVVDPPHQDDGSDSDPDDPADEPSDPSGPGDGPGADDDEDSGSRPWIPGDDADDDSSGQEPPTPDDADDPSGTGGDDEPAGGDEQPDGDGSSAPGDGLDATAVGIVAGVVALVIATLLVVIRRS